MTFLKPKFNQIRPELQILGPYLDYKILKMFWALHSKDLLDLYFQSLSVVVIPDTLTFILMTSIFVKVTMRWQKF